MLQLALHRAASDAHGEGAKKVPLLRVTPLPPGTPGKDQQEHIRIVPIDLKGGTWSEKNKGGAKETVSWKPRWPCLSTTEATPGHTG